MDKKIVNSEKNYFNSCVISQRSRIFGHLASLIKGVKNNKKISFVGFPARQSN